MTPRRSLVFLVALVVVASVAATAHGLFAVAVSASVPWQVACLYPLITDGLALVAYWATKELRAATYPWLVVVVAAGLSGLAQAVNLAGLGSSPTWLRFGVGFWPAVAVLLAAHLYWLVKEEERNVEADEGREAGRAEGVQGGQGGAGREQGQDGDGPVPGGERPGDQGGEGRPLVPDAVAGSAGVGDLLSTVAGSPGNGHGRTKTALAVEVAVAFQERNGLWPNRDQLAVLADCSGGTAGKALALTKKG